ncbi:MAG: carbohydrate binding domain-containing protein, partial [Bacteroidetes bacterium]|nr:carbohydrate binding domain-containing protein [Bacteroidota bacterium]
TNLLENGDFSDGTAAWTLRANDGGAADMAVANGELRIDISSPGPHQWSIGLGQSGFTIQKGTAYSLSFRARADSSRIMTSVVQLGHDPWTAYSNVNSTDLIAAAADGKSGLEAVYEYSPDLIICDYNMPAMKGDEFHNELIDNPKYKKIPFIFLSAIADEDLIIERR